MALRNPLLDKYKSGKTALGVIVNSPDMIEVCAKVGFDWVEIDQMFTAFDWSDVQYMIRTAEAAGVTPVVRIQSYPWLGYDHRIPVDVSRALAIGAQFVMVSHSGKREIEECLSLADDWHRKALWLHPFKNFDEWGTVTEEMKEGTFIIPQPESTGALADLDETLALPGVKMLFFAMGDLSKSALGIEETGMVSSQALGVRPARRRPRERTRGHDRRRDELRVRRSGAREPDQETAR